MSGQSCRLLGAVSPHRKRAYRIYSQNIHTIRRAT
jgi:hypothetical protein